MRRAPVTSLLALAGLLPLILSCGDSPAPAEPSVAPEAEDPPGLAAPADIRPSTGVFDADSPGGNPGFHWLPPISDAGDFSGVFDASLASRLTVEVCELEGDECAGDPVRSYSSTGSGPYETIQLSTRREYYQVYLDTRAADIGPATDYRVRVMADGDLLLGYADVDVAATPAELEEVDGDTFVGVLEGDWLAIRWRAEEGVTEFEPPEEPPGEPPGFRWVQVSAGRDHTCGVVTSGRAYCWGDGRVGTRGDGMRTENQLTPVLVEGGHSWTSITAGYVHTCGVTTTGAGYCWGWEAEGRLGNGSSAFDGFQSEPVPISGDHRWAQLDAGDRHTCGVTMDGHGYCWGVTGALGDGSAINSVRATPTRVEGGQDWRSIAAARAASCGVVTTGDAYCWGSRAGRQIGDGDHTLPPYETTPVQVAGGHSWANVVVGTTYSCGVTTAGAAYCWGIPPVGSFGTGERVWDAVPIPMEAGIGESWRMLTAAIAHTCGVTTAGAAYCWGEGAAGQLGHGRITTDDELAPALVAGGLTWASIDAGFNHACGVTTDGRAYCWGSNASGKAGTGATVSTTHYSPAEVVTP